MMNKRQDSTRRETIFRNRVAVSIQDRGLVVRIGVPGHQPHRMSSGPPMKLAHQRLRPLDVAGPRRDGEDQAVLGVVGDMIQVVPLEVIGRVGAVAGRLLLGDERPLLLELDLGGPVGEKGDQFVVGGHGMLARVAGVAGHGVAVDPDQPPHGSGASGTAGCPCARWSGPRGMRRDLLGPWLPVSGRYPAPRLPRSGRSEFRQLKRERSSKAHFRRRIPQSGRRVATPAPDKPMGMGPATKCGHDRRRQEIAF